MCFIGSYYPIRIDSDHHACIHHEMYPNHFVSEVGLGRMCHNSFFHVFDSFLEVVLLYYTLVGYIALDI